MSFPTDHKKSPKVCPIDALGMKHIDYKDTAFLKKFITKFNKITPRRYSGVTLKNQKKLAQAIKRARYMALMPYVLDFRPRAVEPAAVVITDFLPSDGSDVAEIVVAAAE